MISKQKSIIEDELGIEGNYQDAAFNSRNIFLSNWHVNKITSIGLLLDDKDKYVIDLGAGAGIFEYFYAGNFQKIYALDYHQSAVAYINEKCKKIGLKNVETFLCDINKVDIKMFKHKVDVIVILDVIEHIGEPELDELLKKSRTILSPNGRIIITTPNYCSPWVLIEKILDMTNWVPKLGGKQHITRYTIPKLYDFCTKSDMHVNYATTINTFSFLFPLKSFARLLLKIEFKIKFKYGNLILMSISPTKI